MRIAIYTQNLSGLAGIERVVREHLRIFPAHGAECLVFGEARCEHVVPLRGEARRAAVRALLEAFRPDVCLLHGVSHEGVGDDAAVLKALGIPSVAVCHFSFPSAILLDGDEAANRIFLRGARLCDAVATVSAIDAQWWRALGLRAFHVQNPFVHPKMNAGRALRRGEATVKRALWVGRTAQQKQPSAALAAFAGVSRTLPEARLTMVGGSAKGWRPYAKMARRLGIADKVEFLPARDDLADLWASADLHLLTSVTESFCLVLAEAKAWGIPTAMFDIPFLELTESKKGLIVAPQGDTEALARGIIRVFTDDAYRAWLGHEASESLAPFNDDAVWAGWERLFDALRTGQGGTEVSPEVRTIVAQQTFAWDDFCARNLWALGLTRDWSLLTHTTLRPIARLASALVRALRAAKAFLR